MVLFLRGLRSYIFSSSPPPPAVDDPSHISLSASLSPPLHSISSSAAGGRVKEGLRELLSAVSDSCDSWALSVVAATMADGIDGGVSPCCCARANAACACSKASPVMRLTRLAVDRVRKLRLEQTDGVSEGLRDMHGVGNSGSSLELELLLPAPRTS